MLAWLLEIVIIVTYCEERASAPELSRSTLLHNKVLIQSSVVMRRYFLFVLRFFLFIRQHFVQTFTRITEFNGKENNMIRITFQPCQFFGEPGRSNRTLKYSRLPITRRLSDSSCTMKQRIWKRHFPPGYFLFFFFRTIPSFALSSDRQCILNMLNSLSMFHCISFGKQYGRRRTKKDYVKIEFIEN